MKSKFLVMGLLLLASTATYAAEIVITNGESITVATERTRLPYNLLLVDGKYSELCFKGTPAKIQGIINRMINNYDAKEVSLSLFQVSNDNKLISFGFAHEEEYYNGGSRQLVRYIEKCN